MCPSSTQLPHVACVPHVPDVPHLPYVRNIRNAASWATHGRDTGSSVDSASPKRARARVSPHEPSGLAFLYHPLGVRILVGNLRTLPSLHREATYAEQLPSDWANGARRSGIASDRR